MINLMTVIIIGKTCDDNQISEIDTEYGAPQCINFVFGYMHIIIVTAYLRKSILTTFEKIFFFK